VTSAVPQPRASIMEHARAGSKARRESLRKQRVGRRRVAGGVVWIVAIAVLLAGIVAVNVAVLRLNLNLDGVNRQRAQLKADNAALAAKLATAKRTNRIVSTPGLVQADPTTTSSVTLPR
jgi:hypothetical protein